MEFKAGNRVIITDQGLRLATFRDCTKGKAYKVRKIYGGIGFIDDAGEMVRLSIANEKHVRLAPPFVKGDKFTIRPEGIAKDIVFSECTEGRVYEVLKVFTTVTHAFCFLNDVRDEIVMYGDRLNYIIFEDAQDELIDLGELPDFMGYETAKDFETIIDYALASNDIALFNECTAELEKRGLLKEYAL